MYGFKATDANLKCQNFQFKLNETFYHRGAIEICNSGFHFCEKLIDVHNYYSFEHNNRFFIVKSGDKYETQENKSVTNEITLLKEITSDNLISLVESNEYRDLLNKNIDGLFALTIRFKNKDLLKTIKYLHENGADITADNNYAIEWTSRNGHLEVVKYLHENGADITENKYAIDWASHNGHLEVVKYLHANGAVISVIKWACINGHLDVVKYLHIHGADIAAGNNHAIRWASRNGHLETVKYLHENGADIKAENNYAIKCASRNGHLEIVKYLHTNGADITADDYAIKQQVKLDI